MAAHNKPREPLYAAYAEDEPRRYPPRAIVAVVLGWLVGAVMICAFAFTSWQVLPLMPLFVLGPVVIIKAAHDYARRISPRKPPTHAPSDPTPIGSPYPYGSEPRR